MAAVLDRIPMDRISAEARRVRFGHTTLTLIAAVLYGVGWTTAKLLGGVWLALTWSVTAVRVGWQEAAAPRSDGKT